MSFFVGATSEMWFGNLKKISRPVGSVKSFSLLEKMNGVEDEEDLYMTLAVLKWAMLLLYLRMKVVILRNEKARVFLE